MHRPLRLQQSRWPARLRGGLLLLAFAGSWSLGSAPWYLTLVWLPVFYWLALPDLSWQGSLDEQGRLWLLQPGQPAAQVQLLAQSRVSWLGIWLYWLDPQGRRQQRWLFSDALPDEDRRLLARIIHQLRWQQKRSA